ncbi:maestro heat-like repeat-containing protein family member 7 [Pelodiscus sinensis]|uniref:maestro heat-like repeat-containing protein family member 7 n=1 Tax=Pelodiscus sinensis TaxID=13735 RepID=UPI003F6B49F5
MAKHIRLWFRKALKMAPGPVGSSSSVPADGEAESHQLGATRPPARPLRTWLQRRLGRQDPAQRGSRVGWLWGLLCGEKHLPQEPSPHYHQGASPCPAPGDLPVSGSPQPLRTSPCSCGSSSVSSSAWASSCSRATSCSRSDPEPPCTSAELCQERMDSRVEEGAIYDIEEQLHTRDTSPAALQRFLLAVPPACLAALQRGEDTLAPRCCKDTMMARIVEIMEDSPTPLVLADCLNAACSLSTLQPPLQAQLLSPLLRAAVGQTVSGDWQQEPIHTQQFIRALPVDLQALLASLLAESPDRLQLIMEHLSPWLESRLPQERARALGSTTALLGVATTLPGFENSADWPRMGHHVAQLGLFISDPSEDVSRLARKGVHSLYRLLLHHRGLNIHQAEDLWCRHYYKERWVLAHSNTVRVGEVFGQLFSPEQENAFLETALHAARSPLRRHSKAGLVLAHALQGQAHQLLGYMQEDSQ